MWLFDLLCYVVLEFGKFSGEETQSLGLASLILSFPRDYYPSILDNSGTLDFNIFFKLYIIAKISVALNWSPSLAAWYSKYPKEKGSGLNVELTLMGFFFTRFGHKFCFIHCCILTVQQVHGIRQICNKCLTNN